MYDDVVSTTLHRAEQDGALSEDAKLWVLSALTEVDPGRNAPDDAAGPTGDGSRTGDGMGPAQAAGSGRADAEPARAYLTSIEVEGFRGVGKAAELSITAGPGLTVIAGRNGSGKSSFAEAAELALTRASYRWEERSSVWHESWRNLHQPAPTRITVRLAEEGIGETTVAAQWPDDENDFRAVQVWAQRHGAKRDHGPDPLGWGAALDTFRPFLTYDELGAVFAEPSKLHDAISPMLGLERFDAAVKRLSEHVKRLGAPATQSTSLSRQLLPQLAASTDPRAAQAAAAMRGRPPRLDEIGLLVTGVTGADPDLTLLQELAALQAPDPAPWSAARQSLVEASERHVRALADLGAVAMTSAPLLRAALDYHAAHGDGPCPVCQSGALDAAWATAARDEVSKAGIFQDAVTTAEGDIANARHALTAASPPLPFPLTRAVERALPDLPSVATAQAAWSRLADLLNSPETSEPEVLGAFAEARATATTVASEAKAAEKARQSSWQPLALELAAWLAAARSAAAVADEVAAVKAAEKWLKENAAQLRNDRLQPLAAQARAIWAVLRQESNIDLGEVKLAGSANRRRVDLLATVDGEQAGAFGVMSQGEVLALALALFLPRATAPASPFGFIVIDDPVQAMDPAKVDGLAKVLAETAKQRQVIVFTHDDRLPEAIRRLQIDAHILEVTRQSDSEVSIEHGSNPADRFLSDARAIARGQADNPEVVRRVIPALCRWALEATCKDIYFQRQLKRGTARVQVEAAWTDAIKTSERLALALYDTPRAQLDPWLNPRRKVVLGICTGAPHRGLIGDPVGCVRDVEHVMKELTAGAG